MASAITTSAKVYFDRDIVKNAMDRKTYRALLKASSFLARRARTSMRYRNIAKRGGGYNYSPPGSPPYAHTETGAYVRKLLDYGYDLSSKSAVIGSQKKGSGKAPNVLEFGGNASKTTAGRNIRGKWAARAFMGPALDEEIKLGNIPRQWGGGLKD